MVALIDRRVVDLLRNRIERLFEASLGIEKRALTRVIAGTSVLGEVVQLQHDTLALRSEFADDAG